MPRASTIQSHPANCLRRRPVSESRKPRSSISAEWGLDRQQRDWVSLNPELGFERLSQHHRYSQRLRLDVASRFPPYFGTDLPEMNPPMDDAERMRLAKLFGDFGERSWTGLNIDTRFDAT